MNTNSAFRPIVDFNDYEIILGPAICLFNHKETENESKQPKTPNDLSTNSIMKKESKTNENEMKEEIEQPKKEKKYWSFKQKQFAVAKARLIGLTKAAKFLRITDPETYGDLSSSTLQYWVKKDRQYH